MTGEEWGRMLAEALSVAAKETEVEGHSYVAVLVNGGEWLLYDTSPRSAYEARRLAEELTGEGAVIRVLVGSPRTVHSQLDGMNVALLEETIPGVQVDANLPRLDVERLLIEKGYGCDRDSPYVCSFRGFNAAKLARLYGRVARGELADDMVGLIL